MDNLTRKDVTTNRHMKEEQCGTCLTLKATPRFDTSLQQFRGNR